MGCPILPCTSTPMEPSPNLTVGELAGRRSETPCDSLLPSWQLTDLALAKLPPQGKGLVALALASLTRSAASIVTTTGVAAKSIDPVAFGKMALPVTRSVTPDPTLSFPNTPTGIQAMSSGPALPSNTKP